MTTLLLLLSLGLLFAATAKAAGALKPARLRCEYAEDPIGLDENHPRLFWIVESGERGQVQSAYRILVASTPELLARDKGDLWDTGKFKSDQTTHIEYSGKPLSARKQAWWKVRVWDREGAPSDWSAPARFELGLLKNDDWSARWIGLPGGASEEISLDGASWIWYPELDENKVAPNASRLFRLDFAIPKGKKLDKALLALIADNAHTAQINGAEVTSGNSWQRITAIDVTQYLKAGSNILTVVATNHGGPAGLAGVLQLQFTDQSALSFKTDDSWQTAKDAPEGWMTAQTPEGEWTNVVVIGKVGIAPWGKPKYGLPAAPAPFLRKDFETKKAVRRARIYASALGLYRLYLDGKRVGDSYFTPGWTDYKKRVGYQTYDVTSQIKRGRHAVGMVLGDGWYCGNVCWFGRNQYGPKPMGLIQLELEYTDGSKQVIASDRSWKVSTGPILENDLLMGESYDARREMSGWSSAGFKDDGWMSAASKQIGEVPLVSHNLALVEKVEELKPQKMWPSPNGAYVFDLGQNMVGVARLRVKGKSGEKVTLRFAEVLNPDQSIYTTNLRSAKQTDTYVLKGGTEEVWEPSFTFHGFRYIELSGYPGEPPKDAVTGLVLSSANEPSGSFRSSNAMVNQLQHNIVWGMMGNYLEVPTDCPQRDERLGWMGDAEVFIRTGCFNFNIAPFMTKWIQDVRDAQSKAGAYTDVSPGVLGENNSGAPAWGDAGVIVPWTVYLCYGDKRILARHYSSMKRWVAYIHDANPNLIWTKKSGNNYGDWLSINADTPKDLLATAYFARSTYLLSQAAQILGKPGDAKVYGRLFQDIKAAFNKTFVTSDGLIQGDTQTCYTLALAFRLLDDNMVTSAEARLVKDIVENRGGHLSTGFVGTGILAPTLSAIGRHDVAYKLLLNDTFPSWGYTISHGATTIWERWDGWTSDKGFQDAGMNSFNHYAFGAIGEWIYARVAGIDLDPAAPGYKRILIRPSPGAGVSSAQATLEAVTGTIKSEWKRSPGLLELNVTVPANTVATIFIPATSAGMVSEGLVPASRAKGVKFLRFENSTAIYEVGGGSYRFTSGFPNE